MTLDLANKLQRELTRLGYECAVVQRNNGTYTVTVYGRV